MPAMFAYELPPSRRAGTDVKPAFPVRVPTARGRLTERETRIWSRSAGRIGSASTACSRPRFCWRSGDFAKPRPYRFPTSMSSICDTSCHLRCPRPSAPTRWEWLLILPRSTTRLVVDLARDIAETFRADLSDGVIQQSMLHFRPQYDGGPRGLPDVVCSTQPCPSPSHAFRPWNDRRHGDLFDCLAGIDMYIG